MNMLTAQSDTASEMLAFLYRAPIAVVQMAEDGAINMLTPQAAALLLPLSDPGNFTNLFNILDPLAPRFRQLVNDFSPPSGAVFDGLPIEIPATAAGRATLTLEISVHKINPDNLMVLFTDITERKRVENELLHRTAIIDGLPENICVIDISGNIVITNQAWEDFARINEGSRERCGVGTNYFSVFHPSDAQQQQHADEFVDGIRAVLNGTAPTFRKEYSCHSPNEERWFICRANPFTVADAKYVVISHENITWRKHAESRLKKLSLAIEQSPISIIITDAAGNIEFVNQSFCNLTGYSAEEVMGRNPRLLKAGNLSDQFYANLWATITAGGTWDGEFHNRRKDGTLFWEHAIVSPLYDETETITNFIAVKENVTEKKKLIKQLIHAQKMEAVGQLAGGIAHDFNNKLTVIFANADLAALDIDDRDKVQGYLREIRRAAEYSRDITRRLLTFSRQEVISSRPLDVNQIIAETLSSLARLIGEQISITFAPGDDLWNILMDPVQFDQVIMNLAINARDAMPGGGTFAIETANFTLDTAGSRSIRGAAPGSYILITFRDTGIGMAPETVPHIFEPFFTTKEVGRGTGLGLATIHGILSQNNGFIEVASTPGHGSEFRVYLPRSPEPSPGNDSIPANAGPVS